MIKKYIKIALACLIGTQGYVSITLAQDHSASNVNSIHQLSDDEPVDEQISQQANAFYNRGNAYAAYGKMDAAIQDYTQAITLNPDHVDAYHNRGNAYLSLGRIKAAIQDYNHVLTVNPNDAFAYTNRGNAYAELGQLDIAIRDYTQAIQLNPDVVDTYYNRGDTYLELRQFESAIQDFTHVITRSPNDVSAYTKRGEAYWRSGQPETAIQDYTQAILLNVDLASAYYERGTLYRELEQFESAIQDYTHVIRIHPDNAEAYFFRGIAYAKLQQYEAATHDFTQAVTMNPRQANWYYKRGKAYMDSGNVALAIQDFSQAIVTDPRHTYILPHRSLAYHQIGEHEKADADDRLYQALQNSSSEETFQTLMEKGLHAHDTGKYEESLIWYTEARMLETNAWVWYEIGYSYVKMAEYEKAFKAFQNSVAINPNYSQAYAQMGFILSTQHDYTTSNLMYFMAFMLNPEDHSSLQNIAVNLSIIDKQTALEFYRVLMQRFPDDVLLLYNLSQVFEDTETVYSTIQEIDSEHLLSETITYFKNMSTQTQDIHESEIAYFIALTLLAHNNIDEAKDYLQQCVNGDNEYTKTSCRAIIEQEYHVESVITEKEFLNAAKHLLNIPEK